MNITIDQQEIDVPDNITILEAAQLNDIYIPNLCYHPELTPYGGCRLCIVEVEGLRGYPTACTTKVKAGMNIKTNTKTLNDMRKEILQLILSDHPSGCLLCDEQEECSSSQVTIRKVGATTGCRWCPNDQDCELQKIVEYLDIKQIIFPVYYQGFPVETEDPFFDRDYNLCIYCGRCVRICQEHRRSEVITMNQRGKLTTIGPPYNLTHIEGGCEFCGACVSICPTGANFEKSRKWSGPPESYEPSFCPLCNLNCDLQALVKNNKIIGTLPPGDPHLSGGELCVKGRFCISELINYPQRELIPKIKQKYGYQLMSWENSIAAVKDIIKDIHGEKIAIYLSPELSLEELTAVKIFSSEVIHCSNLTSSIVNNNLIKLAELSTLNIPVEDIDKADCIISVFLNGNYNYAPVTLAIKRAAERGVPYYQIGWFNDTTSRFTEKQISLKPGKEKYWFKKIVNYLDKGGSASSEIQELIRVIKISPSPVIVLGHQFIDLTEGVEMLKLIKRFIQLTAAKIYVTLPYGNLLGLLGVVKIMHHEDIEKLWEQNEIELIYSFGDLPFSKRPPVKYIIHQSSYPPSGDIKPDVIFPTPTWGETDACYVDDQMIIKKFKKVVNPPENLWSGLDILGRLAREMDKSSDKFKLIEIMKSFPEQIKLNLPDLKKAKKEKIYSPDPDYPYQLIEEVDKNRFLNISINKTSKGFEMILPQQVLIINPIDAEKLGLSDNQTVIVQSRNISKTYPLKIRTIIQPGFLYLITKGEKPEFETNPCPVHIRRQNV